MLLLLINYKLGSDVNNKGTLITMVKFNAGTSNGGHITLFLNKKRRKLGTIAALTPNKGRHYKG